MAYSSHGHVDGTFLFLAQSFNCPGVLEGYVIPLLQFVSFSLFQLYLCLSNTLYDADFYYYLLLQILLILILLQTTTCCAALCYLLFLSCRAADKLCVSSGASAQLSYLFIRGVGEIILDVECAVFGRAVGRIVTRSAVQTPCPLVEGGFYFHFDLWLSSGTVQLAPSVSVEFIQKIK